VQAPKFFEDSSSSNDFDIEDLLDNDIGQMVVMLDVEELKDRKKKMLRGSKVIRFCIPRNRIRDYFAKVPIIYPAHLSCRCCQILTSLFVKIVEACKANALYLTRGRNDVGLIRFSA
jgi:hypothetical protein